MHHTVTPARKDDSCQGCFDDAEKRIKILSNNNETRSPSIVVERILDMARGQMVSENHRISRASHLLSLLARRQNPNEHACSLILRNASEENDAHMELLSLQLLTRWCLAIPMKRAVAVRICFKLQSSLGLCSVQDTHSPIIKSPSDN
jgi:hypothetical protein